MAETNIRERKELPEKIIRFLGWIKLIRIHLTYLHQGRISSSSGTPFKSIIDRSPTLQPSGTPGQKV